MTDRVDGIREAGKDKQGVIVDLVVSACLFFKNTISSTGATCITFETYET